MAKQKVIILGGKGMLGSDLTYLCSRKDIQNISLDLPEFDITNKRQLKEAIKNADAVINCAAYTDVEKAESEQEKASKINAEAVGNLGAIAKDLGVWILHISTDFVFDGKSNKPYTETDKPNPLNAYGRSKFIGEQLLVASGCRYCIIRLEWMYGSKGNNFVTKLISAAKQKRELKVVDDQIGSPTATEEAAKAILKLLEKRAEGLFHFASSGFTSRYDMAKFIFGKVGIPVKVNACKTSDLPSAAARPLNSRFDCSKISALLDEPIEGWEKPLERFLTKLAEKGFV